MAAPGLSCSIWDPVPLPGIEPNLPALGADSLTTGPPGKSCPALFRGDYWVPFVLLMLGTESTFVTGGTTPCSSGLGSGVNRRWDTQGLSGQCILYLCHLLRTPEIIGWSYVYIYLALWMVLYLQDTSGFVISLGLYQAG